MLRGSASTKSRADPHGVRGNIGDEDAALLERALADESVAEPNCGGIAALG